jgi:NF-kappa-B inhibitor-like protein 1
MFYPTTKRSNSRKRHLNEETESSKRPKISKEKRKAFEENMKLEHQKQMEEMSKVRNMLHLKSLEIYETMCMCLFGGVPKREIRDKIISDASKERSKILRLKFSTLEDKSVLLRYNDIPWPVKADAKFKYRWDICEDLIVEFLFKNIETGSKFYAQRLKKEQRRWHPDRFLQKCSARLKETDKDIIIDTVTRISQLLNKLSQERK